MIDLTNLEKREELAYILGEYTNSLEDASDLERKVTDHFIGMYKDQLDHDIKLFDSKIEKDSKEYKDSHEDSNTMRNSLKAMYHGGAIDSFKVIRRLWVSRRDKVVDDTIKFLRGK